MGGSAGVNENMSEGSKGDKLENPFTLKHREQRFCFVLSFQELVWPELSIKRGKNWVLELKRETPGLAVYKLNCYFDLEILDPSQRWSNKRPKMYRFLLFSKKYRKQEAPYMKYLIHSLQQPCTGLVLWTVFWKKVRQVCPSVGNGGRDRGPGGPLGAWASSAGRVPGKEGR